METKFRKLRFSEFTKAGTAAAAAVGGAVAMGPGSALAMFTTGTNANAFQIFAGNAMWELNNNVTFTTTSSGWGFEEATLSGGAFNDAFDGAISFLVSTGSPTSADVYQSPNGRIDISPVYPTDPSRDTTATGAVQVMAGLNVHGVITFFHTKAIARSILIMSNPTAAPITVNVRQDNNWGSDNNTTYKKTSSGDAVPDPSDNWYVTQQETTPGSGVYSPSDPPLTYVFNGPGAEVRGVPNPIPVTGDGDTNMLWNNITIPPGGTKSIMVFIEMSTSAANAIADAPMFASAGSLNAAGLLNGVSAGILSSVVNHNSAALLAATAVPTMSDYALMALGALLGFFGLRRLSKALPRRSTAAS